jgi:predicted PurR-regulated permease PerM
MKDVHPDLTRPTLAILFIAALILTSAWILRPFMGATIWATMIVVATWPIMLRVQAMLWGRRALAVTVMTLLLLMLLVVPLALAIGAIVENADQVMTWSRSLATLTVPPAPEWVATLPLVGEKAAAMWNKVAATGIQELAAKAAPYANDLARWLIAELGSVGMLLVQFLLTVIIAAIMFAGGDSAATGMLMFGHRLGGSRGEDAIRLAGQAIRGVALGVVVTALAQSLLGGIALGIAGIPFATLLTGVMFMLCIAQLGPMLVLIPAVVWLYWSGDTSWGTFLLVSAVIVGTMDNFLRPLLIKMGADLPLLLILAGVIGGLLAFGLVGIFVGPVVLAVAYSLLVAWVGDTQAEAGPDISGAGR